MRKIYDRVDWVHLSTVSPTVHVEGEKEKQFSFYEIGLCFGFLFSNKNLT